MNVPISRMINLIPILNTLKQKEDLIIVETGAIRNPNLKYAVGDGWSTYWIAKWVKENGGKFISIDLDTRVAKEFITKLGLQNFVNFLEGNSLELLPTLPTQVSLVLLDSANDADHILAEFLLIENRARVCVIDDTIMGSTEVVKGQKVIPYAQKKYNIKFKDRLAIIELSRI